MTHFSPWLVIGNLNCIFYLNSPQNIYIKKKTIFNLHYNLLQLVEKSNYYKKPIIHVQNNIIEIKDVGTYSKYKWVEIKCKEN